MYQDYTLIFKFCFMYIPQISIYITLFPESLKLYCDLPQNPYVFVSRSVCKIYRYHLVSLTLCPPVSC